VDIKCLKDSFIDFVYSPFGIFKQERVILAENLAKSIYFGSILNVFAEFPPAFSLSDNNRFTVIALGAPK